MAEYFDRYKWNPQLFRTPEELNAALEQFEVKDKKIKAANCNIKLSISSVRINQVTAGCGLGEEGAVGDQRAQAGRAGQAAKILSISSSNASSGVL